MIITDVELLVVEKASGQEGLTSVIAVTKHRIVARYDGRGAG